MSATRTSDFKPLHNPALSPVPDLFAWVKKQPLEFQAQVSTMPIEAFRESQFKTYCPHCLIDHHCMTLTTGRSSKTTQGLCIQCQYFLNTGRRGAAQH